MESERLVAHCPDEFLLHRDDVEISILNRTSDIVGYRRSIKTSNSRFEALTIYPSSQIEGDPGSEWVSLSVRKSVTHTGLFNRSAITRGSYAASILANDCFIGAMNAGYSLRSISIRRAFLEQAREELWVDSLRFLQRSAVYGISEQLFNKMNRELEHIEYAKLSESELDQKVLDLFLTLLASLEDSDELATTNRHRIVHTSITYLKRQPIRRVSPLELAEVSHCSPRTLQYAFRKTLGISPKNYIDRVRLSQFRKAHLEVGEECSQNLQDLAMEYGFTHGGNLSKSYKKLFGRLPSERCPCDVHDAHEEAGGHRLSPKDRINQHFDSQP